MTKSQLEDKLLFQIKAIGLPIPEREYKAIPGRRFRFDMAYISEKLLIEVQGGTWAGKPSHTSGSGIRRDCEKNNLAILNGYKVLHFTSDMIHSGEALKTIEEVLG